MSKSISSLNYLVIYLYISFFTYQAQLLNFPISPNLLLFSIVSILFIQTIDFTKYKKNIFLFILLILFSMLTLTITPNKIEGIQRLISLGAMIVFIFIIVYRQFNKQYVTNFLLHAVLLGSIYIIISFLMFDDLLDYKGEFEGFMHNRHNISALLGIYFVLTLIYLFSRKNIFSIFLLIPILYLDLYLIFYSFARIGFFIIGIFLLACSLNWIYKSTFFFKAIFILSMIFATIYGMKFIFENEYIIYAIERGLTGRDEIATALMSHLYSNPFNLLIGFGIGSLETIGSGLTIMAVRDVNNVVGVLFEYGLIGLSLFLMIFINYFYMVYCIMKKSSNIDYLIFIPLVVMLIPSETTWLNFNNFETIIMYVFIAYTLKQYQQLKRKKLEN